MDKRGTNGNETPRLTRLGIALRDLREERGWSIPQLAGHSGVDKSIISRLENGITIRPQARNLTKLACALGVDPIDLRELARPIATSPIEDALRSSPDALTDQPDQLDLRLKSYPLRRALDEVQTLLSKERDERVLQEAGLKLRELADLLLGRSPGAAEVESSQPPPPR